ncbi:MAG: D-glycero-beta-D-manno-heptose-7-phosphate kinase [Flavobacteriales bacterium]|nr:D-glycero-beta-D-manno-heptose-7-phosphate kinase [Flavobacteriales bacterium]
MTDILKGFENKRVLIVGDVMVDTYMWGEINRMSPESPVPVVDIINRENRLGGAANVALNIISLGAEPILFSVIGKDKNGDELLKLLDNQNIDKKGILVVDKRITTVKTRVISEGNHILRIDEEQIDDLKNPKIFDLAEKLIEKQNIDVIIFEDYNKGFLTEKLINKILDLAKSNHIPTIVDPKKKNFFSYKGVDVFKPNLKEINEGLSTNIDIDSHEELFSKVTILLEKIQAKNILLTLSEGGIYLQNKEQAFSEPAHPRKIRDVSGAGDSVVAVSALALASGLNVEQMMKIANLAGGLVCEKVGVVPISRKDLMKTSL